MTPARTTRQGKAACRETRALLLAAPAVFAALLVTAIPSYAQNDRPPPPGSVVIPEAAPDLPPPVQSGEPLEPEVQIILREKETVTEYRVNGRLRAIKVVPTVGPAYYLVDKDGDGSLETRGELDGDLLIPQWVIFSW